MSFNLQELEDDLFEGLDDPPLPPRQSSTTKSSSSTASNNKHGGRRLSKARARYESSVRQAVEHSNSQHSSILVRAHRGWLEKQASGFVKNWKRRFFTFDPATATIAYWQDETCQQKKGEVELDLNGSTSGGDTTGLVTFRDREQHSFVIKCKTRQLNCRAANAHAAITWMACLDNDYFYSSLRTEVDARISFLTKGCIFEKHGRKGSPHDRLVWLTNDEQKIGWSKPPSSKETTRKMTKDAFVYVEQIQAIERGRTTPVFKRRAGGHYKVSVQACRYFFDAMLLSEENLCFTHRHVSTCCFFLILQDAPESQCFSLLVDGRTLDLVAPDTQTAESWITAISYLTLFAHATREKVTATGRWATTIGVKSHSNSTNNVKATQSAARETRQKLEQRGQQIEELNDSSSQLADSAGSFAGLCAQLNEQQGRKGWF